MVSQDTNVVSIVREDEKSYFRIYFLLIFVIAIWGASWPIGKIVATNLPPITAAFFRFTIALPFFFITAKLIEKDLHVDRKLHPTMAILGALQVTLYNVFFLSGLKFTSATDAVLIIAINPTITAIISSRIYPDEKLTRNKIAGLSLAVLGVIIVVIQSPNDNADNRILGNFLILMAALVWATFSSFSRPIYTKVKPLTFTAWGSLYGWLFLMILSPINGSWFVSMDLKIFLSIIYLALLAGVLGNIVYNLSVKSLGPSRASIFINLVPIFGLISTFFILPDEKINFWFFIALFLILAGVYLVNRKNSKR